MTSALTASVSCDESLSETIMKADQFQRFKTASFCLGLLVGLFIQTSTVRANLVISMLGEDASNIVLVVNLVWSIFTSACVVTLLAFLSTLVRASLLTGPRGDDDARNTHLDDMVRRMERQFVLGGILGIYFMPAWALARACPSVLTMSVVLAWCLWCFTSELGNNNHDDDTNRDEEESSLTIV